MEKRSTVSCGLCQTKLKRRLNAIPNKGMVIYNTMYVKIKLIIRDQVPVFAQG